MGVLMEICMRCMRCSSAANRELEREKKHKIFTPTHPTQTGGAI